MTTPVSTTSSTTTTTTTPVVGPHELITDNMDIQIGPISPTTPVQPATPTTLPAQNAPTVPPRKKRRAPPPPVPVVGNVTVNVPPVVPPPLLITTESPPNVVTVPTTLGTTNAVTVAMPSIAQPALPPPPQPQPPPSGTIAVTVVAMPSIAQPALPPPPKPQPPPVLAVTTPPPPPMALPITPPSGIPISTSKASVIQPTTPNSVASYLSMASVALGKIPNTPPLPVVPTPLPTTAAVASCSSQKRQNLAGFENGNWYKIRNVGDNNVVQLDEGNKFICMYENDETSDLQLFRAIQQANGTFRIMAKMQKSTDSIQVWDYLPHRGLLLQKKQSDKTDKYQQNWKSEAVPGFNSMYLIQSGPAPQSQLCLKNNGIAEQITLITKNQEAASDNFAHWYLELQE